MCSPMRTSEMVREMPLAADPSNDSAFAEDQRDFVPHLGEFAVDGAVVGRDLAFIACSESFEKHGERFSYPGDRICGSPVWALIGALELSGKSGIRIGDSEVDG